MNGRVYDYNLGRFMSVDPFVHAGSQGLNPYSYIMNNPLSGTDPTGYEPEKETIEVSKDAQVFKNADGNNYVSAGDGSGDYIKVDSVSGNSGGTQITQSFGDNGQVSSFSATNSAGTLNVSDIGSQQQLATFSASTNSTSSEDRKTGDGDKPEEPSFMNELGERFTNGEAFYDAGAYALGFIDGASMGMTKLIRKHMDIDTSELEERVGYDIGDGVTVINGVKGLAKGLDKAYNTYKKAAGWRKNSRTSRRTARKLHGKARNEAFNATAKYFGEEGVNAVADEIYEGDKQ